MESLRVVAYCERWNSFDRRPGRVISESKARKLDSQGNPYMVALGVGDKVRTLVSVHWSLSSLGVWFLDEAGRRNLKYSFSRVDPKKLFMDEVTGWEYPDAVEGELSSASKVTIVRHQQDGLVQETVSDSNAQVDDTITSYSDVPLDFNWESVPEFGNWTRVSRNNRAE